MELALAAAISVLFAGGIYLILRPNLLRLVIGFGLIANAVNLFMIACGGFRLSYSAPFVKDPERVMGLMDPLPPDIVLTAIVINFAVGALLLIVSYVVFRDFRTDNPDRLPASED